MAKLKAILIALGLVAGSFIVASAATCTNVFPTSLNGYTSGACIPSAWGNALEAKLGITGSAATSSLDYQINHIFTSYGSESITSSSLPWINYGTAFSPSTTWLKTANNLSDLPSTSSARTNLGLGDSATLPSSTWFKVANNLSGGTPSTMRTNLGLGSIATFNSTDYLPSTTAYVSSINGGGSGAYFIIAGTNLSETTTTTSTVLNVTSPTSTVAAGSANDVQFNAAGTLGADSGEFTYTTGTAQLALNQASSSAIIGSSTYFTTSSITITTNLTVASSVASYTVPAGVTSIVIHIVGGGGAGANNNSSLGGNHAWFGTTSTVPVATSTMIFLCGGGGGANENNGAGGTNTPGQGVNGYPDVYGGAAQLNNGSPGNAGSCYFATSTTATSTGTGSNGGSGSVSGSGGAAATGTLTVTPGTVYWYYLGAGGAQGGDSGSTSTLSVAYNVQTSELTSSTYSLAIEKPILTSGPTPGVSSCGTSPTITGNNTAGTISVSGTVTACTLTFSTSTPYSNPPYFSPPVCTISDSLTTGQPDITGITTTTLSMGFGSSLGTGKIYYICIGN